MLVPQLFRRKPYRQDAYKLTNWGVGLNNHPFRPPPPPSPPTRPRRARARFTKTTSHATTTRAKVGHVHILVLQLRLRLRLIGTREHPTPPNERRANLPRSGSEIDSDKVLFEDVVLVRPNPIQPSPPWPAAGYASFGHTYLYNDIWV